MSDADAVVGHYTQGNLLRSILVGVEKLGKTPETLSIEDLAPVDEFHVGGQAATRSFLDQLSISPHDHVLDIGCGIGGASRFAADAYQCRVTGVDLTEEYVETGSTLCGWLGLASHVRLLVGDASALHFPDSTFDKAFMLHVGMNIEDKAVIAKEVGRALKPGAVFGIYDIMRCNDESLSFPVPWAASPKSSFLRSPGDYKRALEANGFEVISESDRRDFALEFFKALKAGSNSIASPPPLGLHILMGSSAPTKYANMVENISLGKIAPVELIARRL